MLIACVLSAALCEGLIAELELSVSDQTMLYFIQYTRVWYIKLLCNSELSDTFSFARNDHNNNNIMFKISCSFWIMVSYQKTGCKKVF